MRFANFGRFNATSNSFVTQIQALGPHGPLPQETAVLSGDMGRVFPGLCVAEKAPSQRLEAPEILGFHPKKQNLVVVSCGFRFIMIIIISIYYIL
jgi:hypothetical protein